MKTEKLYTPLIKVLTYQEIGEKPVRYAHIKKSDYPADYNEVGILLVAGMMLDKEELDLLIINETPFTQQNMRTKGGRFVWKRYTENAVNAFNIDILNEFIEFANSIK